jgi:hypothetical protein
LAGELAFQIVQNGKRQYFGLQAFWASWTATTRRKPDSDHRFTWVLFNLSITLSLSSFLLFY